MKIQDRPYLLLTMAVLFWAGNFILGRAFHNDIPPIALAFWRWLGASVPGGFGHRFVQHAGLFRPPIHRGDQRIPDPVPDASDDRDPVIPDFPGACHAFAICRHRRVSLRCGHDYRSR